MVVVDANLIAEGEQNLLEFLSSDSDADDSDAFIKKCGGIEPMVTLDKTFPNAVVVVGTPKAPQEKLEKLLMVLRKILKEELGKKGIETGEAAIDMPFDENHMTRGFCFISFSSAHEAQQAIKCLNGYALDSKHKFKAQLLDKVDEIANRDESYKPPIKLLGFTRENFRWWLHDERGREQFAIRYQDETEIFWHDPVEHDPVMVYNGNRERAEGKRVWTDFRVQWSPQGSYLATFHRPGIALWAGPNFEKKVRFEHKDVKQIDFSPNEEYVLTWDGSPSKVKKEFAVRIWKVTTGELLASFPTPVETPRGGDFPLFLWSHDDSYIAKMGEDTLFVYELPSMSLMADDKSKRATFKYPLKRFDWSPGDNILSIWTPESKDAPGRLLLIEVPSRKELACKNVYNVDDASMHWQSKGDFLALRTIVRKKTGKKGRKTFTQLEIFRMREKNIPVDIIHIEDVRVKQLHWEEGFSNRFGLVVEDELTNQQSLRFYRVCDASGFEDIVLIERFDISQVMNFMKWSPQGMNFILASKSEFILLFCTLNENDKVEVLHKDEHLNVNEIRWSSCGRYVTTAVSMPMISSAAATPWRFSGENGFIIWTFQGKMHYKSNRDKFYQFMWRPHPPSLLSDKKLDEIRKNLREFSKKFDMIDDKLRTSQRDAFLKARKSEMDEFEDVLRNLENLRKTHDRYEEWEEAKHYFNNMFDWEDLEETHEEEMDVREEIV
ncbi:putative eukaryotic translation initiation factor [Cardiosporidium cionae]|uniref:Eukaryotic translation initiation factor 3 subunit B n=1 Tax=Cardiosporidium cionae TaxID=476202 RepID=A0ABQ7J9J2_9APIC|nr:putative eukaryotic translation initiation factor [Cardiosporidium cionae]|eukprot:KAF8820624.1 putative eukaryotic translation initiation factor [Cardiosporidium cionae]